MNAPEDFFEFVVREVVERIKVGADCAGEEDWVLWDNCEARAEVVQLYSRDVHAVNNNTSFFVLPGIGKAPVIAWICLPCISKATS